MYDDAEECKDREPSPDRALLVTEDASVLNVPARVWDNKVYGSGSYGVVYKHPRSVSPQVVKLLYGGGGRVGRDVIQELVMAEFRLLAKVNVAPEMRGVFIEPAVPSKADYGRIGFVMDEGQPVHEYLKVHRVFTVAHVRDLLRKFVTWRRAGIVHGDVKPYNLIVVSDSQVQVIDWGLGLLPFHCSLPAVRNCLIYTPGYRAPELCLYAKGHVDWDKAEAWATAVTALQLLVGFDDAHDPDAQWPFVVINDDSVQLDRAWGFLGRPTPPCAYCSVPEFLASADVPRRSLRDHRKVKAAPWVTDDVLDVLTKMLEPDPALRWGSSDIEEHPFLVGSDGWSPNTHTLGPLCTPRPVNRCVPGSGTWISIIDMALAVIRPREYWFVAGLVVDVLEAWVYARSSPDTIAKGRIVIDIRTGEAALRLALHVAGTEGDALIPSCTVVESIQREMLTSPAMPSVLTLVRRCVQWRACERIVEMKYVPVYGVVGLLTLLNTFTDAYFSEVRDTEAMARTLAETFCGVYDTQKLPEWVLAMRSRNRLCAFCVETLEQLLPALKRLAAFNPLI